MDYKDYQVAMELIGLPNDRWKLPELVFVK